MPRLRGGWTYTRDTRAVFDLMLGPTDAPGELSVEQLEVAWEIERDELMADCRRNVNVAWRPWAWWAFSAREPQPEGRVAEARRLAELGELWPEEVEALERRATDALESWVWTAAERYPDLAHQFNRDEESVAVWEAVRTALEEAAQSAAGDGKGPGIGGRVTSHR